MGVLGSAKGNSGVCVSVAAVMCGARAQLVVD